MSTQLKVRLISAAPSCVAVDFISIATRTISERPTTDNLIHVTIFGRNVGAWGREDVGAWEGGGVVNKGNGRCLGFRCRSIGILPVDVSQARSYAATSP